MTLRLRRIAPVWSVAAIVSLLFLLGVVGPGSALPHAAAAPAENQAQDPHPNSRSEDEGVRLPNGKLQRDEILKAEHEQNLKDAAQLVELSGQLKEELEKNDRFVLSVSTLKKTDDIEKLVKKIRSRLRRS